CRRSRSSSKPKTWSVPDFRLLRAARRARPDKVGWSAHRVRVGGTELASYCQLPTRHERSRTEDRVPRARGPALSARRHLGRQGRSEEHTSELQSRQYLVCRLLLE